MKALPWLLVGLSLTATGCQWPSPVLHTQAGVGPVLAALPPRPQIVPGRRAPPPRPPATNPRNPVRRPLVELGTPTAIAPEPANRSAAKPAMAPTAQSLPRVAWTSTYESTQRRPIETVRLGTGPEKIFVTGSLAGDDAASVQLIDALAGTITARPEVIDGKTILIVRNPNPDALAEHISVNTRGVNLNRNFPSVRFTAVPTQQTGPSPASEAETRIMLRLVGDFQPGVVIHLRSSTISRRPLVMATVPAVTRIASVLGDSAADFDTFGGEFKAGSLEEFASTRLKAEAMLVEIPSRNGKPSDYVSLMLSVLGSNPERGSTTPSPSNKPDQTGVTPPIAGTGPQPAPSDLSANPATLTGSVEPEGPDGKLGYVELLPPPPDAPVEDGLQLNSRFHELPPPQ
jgi:hypothetical protein